MIVDIWVICVMSDGRFEIAKCTGSIAWTLNQREGIFDQMSSSPSSICTLAILTQLCTKLGTRSKLFSRSALAPTESPIRNLPCSADSLDRGDLSHLKVPLRLYASACPCFQLTPWSIASFANDTA